KESTLYVTLEPCSHFGKTPPCAHLIIEKKIAKVVIGCIDPFVEVSGKGIQLLKENGIEVVTGVLEKECQQSHQRFFTFHLKKKYAVCHAGTLQSFRKNTAVCPSYHREKNRKSSYRVHRPFCGSFRERHSVAQRKRN